MLTYEYKCEDCDHEFEVERRIADDSEEICPKCGSKHTFRCISSGEFVLKGGGWFNSGGY